MRRFLGLLTLILSACATGSTVMLTGDMPEKSLKAKDQIELFVQPPVRAHKVIALVSASASFAGFGGVAGAEGAALEKLKEQAALAGADGVMEIQREIYLGGVLISSTSLDQKPVGVVKSFGSASAFPGVSFRGKAIKFD